MRSTIFQGPRRHSLDRSVRVRVDGSVDTSIANLSSRRRLEPPGSDLGASHNEKGFVRVARLELVR